MSRQGGVLIIGVGNPFRSDDGAGPAVAERLRGMGFETLVLSGEGAELMDAWNGVAHVILIDAAASGSAAGTVHRFEASEDPVPVGFFHYSSHQFAVAEAIEMARTLERLPARCQVFGIEGTSFSYGSELSDEVEAAVSAVAAEIAETLSGKWS